MKKRIGLVFIIILLTSFTFSCLNYVAPRDQDVPGPGSPNITSDELGRVMIVYFSLNDKVSDVASYLLQYLKSEGLGKVDKTQIEAADSTYSKDNQGTLEYPEVKNQIQSLKSSYDSVFIGYPLWDGLSPKVVSSFVKDCDFSSLRIIPFCVSSDGTQIQNSIQQLQEIKTEKLNFVEGKTFSDDVTEEDVEDWFSYDGSSNSLSAYF